jgi:hypothetical protein
MGSAHFRNEPRPSGRLARTSRQNRARHGLADHNHRAESDWRYQPRHRGYDLRRKKMRFISALAFCLFLASPAWAEEILYCSDTVANGFRWDQDEKVKRDGFKPERFTVKVISETKRVISENGHEIGYSCEKKKGGDYCYRINRNSMAPIIFGTKGFTRAYLFGTPLGGEDVDPNIYVAYGTCTKF